MTKQMIYCRECPKTNGQQFLQSTNWQSCKYKYEKSKFPQQKQSSNYSSRPYPFLKLSSANPSMKTNIQLSMQELPSPIAETVKTNSRRSVKFQQRELQDSESLSSIEDNDILKSLQQKKSQNQNIMANNTTESIKIDREWHPVDFKSSLFADNARQINISQSTQIDITMRQSKKKNPIDQPIINQLENSVYLEESQMRRSTILRNSIHRIRENMSREWAEPNYDMFDDSELDQGPQKPQLIKAPSKQRKNSITVNYPDTNQPIQQKIPHPPKELMPPPILSEAILTSMMHTMRANTQHHQEQMPNKNFLHPQMNTNQHGNMPSSFHPHQDFHPMTKTQHYNNFAQKNQPCNPPTPLSEAGWNHQPQVNHAQNYQLQQYPQSHGHYSNVEVMNELRYLREDVRNLRQQWKEERTERLIEKKLEEKFKSEAKRSRKASDSYERSSVLSADIKTLMDEQQHKHEQRMRQMQDFFMDKLSRLEKEQIQLKRQNMSLLRKSILKQTDSKDYSLGLAEQIHESLRNTSRRSVNKSTSKFEPLLSGRIVDNDNFLVSKLSITRKQSSRKKQSPKKRPVSKRKNFDAKGNNNLKKDKFNLF